MILIFLQQAVEFVMKKYEMSQAVAYGGSHGGFLTTHLIGQFPGFYKSAAVRNAVTHLESIFYTSDIPDWAMCESLGVYDFKHGEVLTPEQYQAIQKRSPSYFVDQVKLFYSIYSLKTLK